MHCLNCHRPIDPPRRKYCSDKCRALLLSREWRAKNPDKLRRATSRWRAANIDHQSILARSYKSKQWRLGVKRGYKEVLVMIDQQLTTIRSQPIAERETGMTALAALHDVITDRLNDAT